jgi:hypothetical protein
MRGFRFFIVAFGVCSSLTALSLNVCAQESLERNIESLVRIGAEGEGNESAAAAVKKLVEVGPSVLLPVVSAAGKGSAVADNWLRVVGHTVVDRARAAQAALPLDELQAFIRDTTRQEPARVLAFELLTQADAAVAYRLEDSLLHDPVQSLRRGAVSKLIAVASNAEASQAKKLWMDALSAVRDEDQTKTVAAALKNLGEEVSLPRHFGFLTRWQIIGPFDNTGRKGFDAVFAPEKEIDLSKACDGKGKPVQWQPLESTDDYGKINFNTPLTALKEATAYAFTSLECPEEREVELRLGCKNAWKVWLNGTLLFGRDEYHRGQKMDQYKLKCRLKKGANSILVKCCQNEQTESWTVEWEFQLRVCDSAGTGLHFNESKR